TAGRLQRPGPQPAVAAADPDLHESSGRGGPRPWPPAVFISRPQSLRGREAGPGLLVAEVAAGEGLGPSAARYLYGSFAVNVQDRVLRWAGQTGRDLPWRRTRDPWAVLVSELMLQQTQVSRVVPKYEGFLA